MWNIVTMNSPGSCCDSSGAMEADFSASNWAYCWSDLRKLVERSALQRDIAM